MANDFSFHIRNAHPGDMVAALATLETHPNLNTIREIVDHAETLGFSIRDRAHLDALITARDLGFVHAKENLLTDRGKALSSLEMNKPDLFPDVVHGCQYALWNKKEPQLYCFSWTYRVICDFLWQQGTFKVDTQGKKDLASEVEGLVRERFERMDISLSTKTVGGALLWLYELVPAVIDDADQFTRRAFCDPELFVLGIDFVYRTNEIDYGINLLLSDEHRNAICQVCLLELGSFDRVLDYATTQFDYLERGVGGGWGQYLALHRAPKLEDFIE